MFQGCCILKRNRRSLRRRIQILMSEKIANRLTLNVLHKQSYDRIEKGRTLRTGVE